MTLTFQDIILQLFCPGLYIYGKEEKNMISIYAKEIVLLFMFIQLKYFENLTCRYTWNYLPHAEPSYFVCMFHLMCTNMPRWNMIKKL